MVASSIGVAFDGEDAFDFLEFGLTVFIFTEGPEDGVVIGNFFEVEGLGGGFSVAGDMDFGDAVTSGFEADGDGRVIEGGAGGEFCRGDGEGTVDVDFDVNGFADVGFGGGAIADGEEGVEGEV